MFDGKKISVILPTYNEERTIARIINGFFDTGFVDEVIAVDNNALGRTAEEIRSTKAVYVRETKQGYGHALMRGMMEAKGDLIVMCEADGTFEPSDLDKFLPYTKNFDAIWGTRTSRAAIWSGAFMPFPVRAGNWAVAKVLEVMHNGPTLTDVGCTFKVLSRDTLERIKPLFYLSRGDGCFSPELMIWIIRRGIRPIEIPVLFKPRIGKSMYTGSIVRAALLGVRMVILIVRYRFIRLSSS